MRSGPSLLEDLGAALPNLLVYLGVASALGVAGSLLVARRVKRQTLGLEPLEITGLVEHRDATLHGIKEGMVAVDLTARSRWPTTWRAPAACPTTSSDSRCREVDATGALAQEGTGGHRPVVPSATASWYSTGCRSARRDRLIGWVTTLRDRTELLELQRELDLTRHHRHAARAGPRVQQPAAHVSGLIELGEYDEVLGYVHRIAADRAQLRRSVTPRIADPAVAALLVAKTSLADRARRRAASSTSDATCPPLDEELPTTSPPSWATSSTTPSTPRRAAPSPFVAVEVVEAGRRA